MPIPESAAGRLPDAPGTSAPCFHCGLPVTEPGRYVAVVDGQPRAMCCAGCQAVTETILGSGLAAFYAARERAVERTPDAGTAAPASLAELEVYDRPEIQSAFVEAGPDGSLEATLLIEGITCAACVWLNETHLARLPGVIRADINYATRRARVRWDPATVRLSRILETIQAIGYRAWPNDSATAERVDRRERRAALWRLFVAAFGMMQVMMYAYPAYIAGDGELTPDVAQLLRWSSLILTLPVVLFSAAPFFRGAWRDLRLGRAGMDVPVALGIAAAFLGSAWATVSGAGEVYFDSVAMFVFFLLGGRWLESAARRKAVEVLRHLSRALPATAERLVRWPDARDTDTIPAVALQPGDHVLVRPGAAFPADGRIVDGETRVDESLITGESRPLARGIGQEVVGGSANASQPVVVRVERAGAQTRLGSIVRLVERAHADRPRFVELADRYASWFVVVVLILAGAAGLAWWWHEPAHALAVAVAVLVVTCPCALSLATPIAFTVATDALARRGLVVTRERAIETLTRVTHVVFDKTGTLTEGRFSLVASRTFGRLNEQRCRAIASALESGSDHPVARALRIDAPFDGEIAAMRHEAGAGIEARVDGVTMRLGSRSFAESLCGALPSVDFPAESTDVWLAASDGPLAAFALGDQLRPDAASAVRALRAAGLEVLLASGDGESAVACAARQSGIQHWFPGQSPEDKHRRVRDLQASGAVVCMIGDGVNDAPVLAAADVSIAMGSGAVLAQRSADLVMVGGRLGMLVGCFAIGRRAMRITRQNLGWAFAYNVIAIPLAAFGWVTPWAAGIGMAASSLFVVLNALRLRRVEASPAPGRQDVAPATAEI